MYNIQAKKHYLVNELSKMNDFMDTNVRNIEVAGNTLIIELKVNVHMDYDFSNFTSAIVEYNLVNDTTKIKVVGKGSKTYNQQTKNIVLTTLSGIVERAELQYKSDVSDTRYDTTLYAYHILKDAGANVPQLNELNYYINMNEVSVKEILNYIQAVLNELQPVIENDITYIVGNKSFYSYGLALDYCSSNDFDPATMIIVEVATMQPLSVDNGTIYDFNYNNNDLSQSDWGKDVNKHFTMYSTLKDREYIAMDHIQKLIDSNYAFTLKIVNSEPYKKNNYVMIDLTFKYGHKPITLYLKKEAIPDIIKAA